ncbi:hypothetical protein GCM10007103_09450 [Salinimicrobium marinum]|uniref:N-acetyltransferase domain-containing protein n=1 Tax=Salinimicrobium marinum TaxID=680283 RepID=A0A918S9R4_9FLAO|nr:GNAT family N-acetyltransferase [Salinimicrobium marinum]GHA30236.1 hypothetical protein GCM10007103_09450 [Salinimicrobium marinum]
MKTKDIFIERLQELEAPEGFAWELINKSHAPVVVKWRNDPAILSFMEMDNKLKLEDQIAFLENYCLYDRVDIILFSKNKPVGVFNIKNLDSQPEYGAIIGEAEYRGKGLGTKVKLLIFKYWFCTLNKETIYSRNKKLNEKIIKSNISWGFEKFGEDEDLVLLKLEKDDFINVSLKKFN